MGKNFLTLNNGRSAALSAVPVMAFGEFRERLLDKILHDNRRLLAFWALPMKSAEGAWQLLAVLGAAGAQVLELAGCFVGSEFESLTADCPCFNRFEREIAEQHGIAVLHHPWFKPLRFASGGVQPGDQEYYRIDGDAIHEVAVGPVHAGVIEPGHFRFQCYGETVHSLEISLGYQHRGIEALLRGGPDPRSYHLAAVAAGDTALANSRCYSGLIEALGGAPWPSPAARLAQNVMLELERTANHIGDLGALAGDVAFLPTASFCGRIRGEYLNLTAMMAGNRFGRHCAVPGGLRSAFTPEIIERMRSRLDGYYRDLVIALELLFNAPSVLDRFEHTGRISRENAVKLGMVGVAGRSAGIHCDARADFPDDDTMTPGAGFAFPAFLPANKASGDVWARAMQRYLEIRSSHAFLTGALERLAQSGGVPAAAAQRIPTLEPGRIAVQVVEAWRGELCHAAITDGAGRFRDYKIVDPSFHNWPGLTLALRGEEISNFPVCNKSFNLSYCGHDL